MKRTVVVMTLIAQLLFWGIQEVSAQLTEFDRGLSAKATMAPSSSETLMRGIKQGPLPIEDAECILKGATKVIVRVFDGDEETTRKVSSSAVLIEDAVRLGRGTPWETTPAHRPMSLTGLSLGRLLASSTVLCFTRYQQYAPAVSELQTIFGINFSVSARAAWRRSCRLSLATSRLRSRSAKVSRSRPASLSRGVTNPMGLLSRRSL